MEWWHSEQNRWEQWADWNTVAVEAFNKIKAGVAADVPLRNPDYAAAADYVRSGRPF